MPATPEPLISCGLAGSAEFREREIGETWTTRQIGRGDIFVTRSRTPYEVRFRSPAGEELETIAIHVGIDSFRAALEAIYPGNASEVEVIDFFGRDVALSPASTSHHQPSDHIHGPLRVAGGCSPDGGQD